MANGPRSSYAYQQMRKAVRRSHALALLPCALCRQPIDYRLRYPNPMAWSLDHAHALHDGGALLDPANAQPAHFRCNASRGASEGNRLRGAPPVHTSCRW